VILPATTSTDVAAASSGIAVLPVGSFEQHGAILPLATDTVIACAVADAIAASYQVLRLPPITISCSHEHTGWPGTVSISAITLAAMVTDIAASLRESGVDRLVLVNGHGGNYVLGNVVQESRGAMALFPAETDWLRARADGGVETGPDLDMHAGELETSLLLHVQPDLVDEQYAEHDHLAPDRDRLLTVGLAAYTESGVVGRPSLASPAKGAAALASLVASFADVLAAFDR
jgi:creatinine amidohydrolase